jgi:CRISPR type IV-associated protein Csf3
VIPLRVTAHLCAAGGALALPDGYLHLDSLLASSVALRDGLPPAQDASEILPIEIPVEREPAGRFHLCSASVVAMEAHALKYVNRRFPVAEAQAIAVPSLRRINIASGAQKSYRIPMETSRSTGDRLSFYLVGDRDEIADLLSLVTHLGKRRGVGLGRLERWEVKEEGEPWHGFPVLAPDGAALRHLPLDWTGLGAHLPRYGRLSYPYWLKTGEIEIAAPIPC